MKGVGTPARAVCTTSWDDGNPLDQRIADLLTKYGLTGTFYVPIENSMPVLAAQQVRQLSEAFEVGAHTVHHAVLTSIPDREAEIEIRESKKQLEDSTGRLCDTFCFPKGRFYRRHLAMVREAGFRYARTVELLATRVPDNRCGLGLIPTTVQAARHRWTTYMRNSIKRLEPRNMFSFAVHVRSRSWAEVARAMMQDVARRGGVFHLWGHSWEIEEQQQWTELELVLRGMQALRMTMPCVSNSKLGSIGAAPVRSQS